MYFDFYGALAQLNSLATRLSHQEKREIEQYIGDLNRRTAQLQADIKKALEELQQVVEDS